MNTLETIDKDALKSRIEKSLSEILSDKHDCKVTLHFVPKDSKRSEKDGRTLRNDRGSLRNDGSGMVGH